MFWASAPCFRICRMFGNSAHTEHRRNNTAGPCNPAIQRPCNLMTPQFNNPRNSTTPRLDYPKTQLPQNLTTLKQRPQNSTLENKGQRAVSSDFYDFFTEQHLNLLVLCEILGWNFLWRFSWQSVWEMNQWFNLKYPNLLHHPTKPVPLKRNSVQFWSSFCHWITLTCF